MPPSRLVALACLAVLTVSTVRPAHAADNTKAAAALAGSARQAYDSGQHAKAAELYLQAWQAAPGQTGLLYNAARASHVAGLWDDAEARYRQFLDLPGHDKAIDAKVMGYLDEVRVKRAEDRARAATEAMQAGDAQAAMALYRAAVVQAPERFEWLPLLAEAERAAGQKESAREHLRTYLDRAPPDAPGRADTQRQLAEWVLADGQAPVLAAEESSGKTPAWIVTGAGLAAAATAGWLWWHARGEQQDLNARLADRDSGNFVRGIGYDEAVAKHDSIGRYSTGAALTGGVAAALTGAGLWWLLRPAKAKVVIAPMPGGVTVGARFF